MPRFLLVAAAALALACGSSSSSGNGSGSGGSDAGTTADAGSSDDGGSAGADAGGNGSTDAGGGGGSSGDAGSGGGSGGADGGGGGSPDGGTMADECTGLTPSALPQSVVATLPQSGCLGGTSDDGVGNYLLGFVAGPGPTYPNYLFFTIQDGQAQRVGGTVPGGDESGTYVFSQPSGFSSFHVSGNTGGSSVLSWSHEGVNTSSQAVATGDFASPPSSQIGIDPSGGTALVRTQKEGSDQVTSYRRLDKHGAPETDWISLDRSTAATRVGAVGVALSGHAFVLLADGTDRWRGIWVDRSGTVISGWVTGIGGTGLPQLQFLMDGSLALRFRATGSPFAEGPWVMRFEDAKAAIAPVPLWLQDRGGNALFVIRNGAAYASWGSAGECGSKLEVVASASGKSCGCLDVPNLGATSSVGRDGSLIVPKPEPDANGCQYDLYPQLLK
jgi:hypothetical protein